MGAAEGERGEGCWSEEEAASASVTAAAATVSIVPLLCAAACFSVLSFSHLSITSLFIGVALQTAVCRTLYIFPK